MGKTVGIDLGTTYSSVSVYDEGSIQTLELEAANGGKLLPSVVFFPEASEPIVGSEAVNVEYRHPERVVVGIKRHMGQNYIHPATELGPAEISSRILSVLKAEASRHLGESCDRAIITVPAYFGEYERKHTEQAGEMAGLEVVQLLPEPHAAVLAYAAEQARNIADRNILMFDVGGGTTDVTLIHVTPKESGGVTKLDISTVDKEGDAHLGGLDWDKKLFELVTSRIARQYDHEVVGNKEEEVLVMHRCEEAKRDLSKLEIAAILGPKPHHGIEVTRRDFEKATSGLTDRLKILLRLVLERAEKKHGLRSSEIDVLLAGGLTRMPMIQNMVREVTGQEPVTYKNPDLLISIGAAYWAHLRQGERVETRSGGLVEVARGGLVDISVQGIGVKMFRTEDDDSAYVRNIIPAGALYDAKEYTADAVSRFDNQTAINIEIFEGDSESLDDVKPLASFILSDLPPRPRGQPVKLVLKYDDSGIIRGRGIDVNTGKEVKIEINRAKLASQSSATFIG